MKKLMATALALAALASSSSAILYTTNWSDTLNPAAPFVNGGVIPDGNLSGWADSRIVTTMPAGTLTSVAVTLNITGGWNGDLYAYLTHGSGFCVLLDGVGPGDFGYGDSGMNVILADAGAMTTLGLAPNQNINDYQTYQGAGIPNGTWNPHNTSGSLASFLGTSPNGTWSLFIADRNSGDVATVSNWGLELDIVAVPEVEAWVAAALAGAFGACWISRQLKPGKL